MSKSGYKWGSGDPIPAASADKEKQETEELPWGSTPIGGVFSPEISENPGTSRIDSLGQYLLPPDHINDVDWELLPGGVVVEGDTVESYQSAYQGSLIFLRDRATDAQVVQDADRRNRELARSPFDLGVGDLLHGADAQFLGTAASFGLLSPSVYGAHDKNVLKHRVFCHMVSKGGVSPREVINEPAVVKYRKSESQVTLILEASGEHVSRIPRTTSRPSQGDGMSSTVFPFGLSVGLDITSARAMIVKKGLDRDKILDQIQVLPFYIPVYDEDLNLLNPEQ